MSTRFFLTCCCLFLSGVGLYFAPESTSATIRGAIADILRPIQLALSKTSSRNDDSAQTEGRPETESHEQLARLTEDLDAERERNRSLQVLLAQAAERLRPELEIYAGITPPQRLFVPSLIDVAVLGDTIAEQWRSGKLLGAGAADGLRENELVLNSRKTHRPLIDAGEDFELSTEDTLLLGRCVIGKVEHVGRWSSTIQLVNDSRYRGRAQLIRQTDTGFVFEAQGILKGQGEPLCRLDGIPAEKSVHIDDAVYTAERDGILPTPLYYGRVEKAELGPDDREWTVYVRPAPLPAQLTKVQVLRTEINTQRVVIR